MYKNADNSSRQLNNRGSLPHILIRLLLLTLAVMLIAGLLTMSASATRGYSYKAMYGTPVIDGEIDDIMIEKMRPTRQPSRYATGTFIDAESPLSLGEKFVPVE